MPWWGWIALGAGLVVVELLLTTDYLLVFFGASALLLGASEALGLGLPLGLQWVAFAALSAAGLILYRRRLGHAWRTVDAVVVDGFRGRDATAAQPIAVGATGQAELSGSRWNALNLGPEPLAPGDIARVEHVRGLTLHVRRVVRPPLA